MSIRSLFAMLVAVAVLFAPALALAGQAAAAVPDHHAQTMESGHCSSAASHSGDAEEPGSDETGDKNCCMAMCLGIATAPPGAADSAMVHRLAPSFALTSQYRGRITEIATPPPKFAEASNS